MIQEYLLQDPAEVDAIKEYKPESIRKRMFSADNGNCWYVQFSVEGENEGIAKQMSVVDEYVRGTFHMTVLYDGCSAYFNRKLFPFVSGFEYKLRKLLYLIGAINHDEKSTSNIADLESLDFGKIFTLLFIDNAFIGKVKEEVKTRNQEVFSKADVVAAIEATEENTLWDSLLGKDSVPTLRKRFNDVRMYRNDIMHAQHLNWEKYRNVLTLFKAIHNEMDRALHKIEVVESKTPSNPEFNQTLESALQAQKEYSAMVEALQASQKAMQQLSALYSQNPAFIETMERIKESYSAFAITPELRESLEELSQMYRAYDTNPAFLELQNQFKALEKMRRETIPAIKQLDDIIKNLTAPRINIPPEFLDLQRNLASFQQQEEMLGADEKEKPIDPSGKEKDNGGHD